MDRSASVSSASEFSPLWVQGPKMKMVWLVVSVGIIALLYWDSLAYLLQIWAHDENFGHGFFVPLISGYLIWQKRDLLFRHQRANTWVGFGIVVTALFLYFVGEFSTIYFLLHVSFWLVLCGMAVALLGWNGVQPIGFPLLFLLTMIPLPQFFLQSLSAQLQLFSSWLGVACLKLAGVMAFRDGNVIDLGPIQLQVAEACSGLRALFPLMTLALICAYFLKGPLWKRVFLFLSSIPIAIILNGFRIGIVGLLVEEYGVAAAEGFYHFFEGWVLFVVSLCVLVAEMWILSKVGSTTTPSSTGFSDSFDSSARLPLIYPESDRGSSFRLSRAYVCSVLIFAPVLLASTHISDREEVVPPRQPFLDFPMEVDGWVGQTFPMEQVYIDTLRFDDYLLADYRWGNHSPVNLYLAYYRSQKKGQSVHSPSTCIPGGGWEIKSMRTIELDTGATDAPPLPVNRVMIQKGHHRQLVYYWFLQRGRMLTNEYLVKGYLLFDALTRNRSDGSLVRLTIPIRSEADITEEEARLQDFVKSVNPLLPKFIPD